MEVCSPHEHVCTAEPHTGFHIAFKMLDVDGNEHVDKKEFLKVRFKSLTGGFSQHVFCFVLNDRRILFVLNVKLSHSLTLPNDTTTSVLYGPWHSVKVRRSCAAFVSHCGCFACGKSN